ncbi:hypothetical protein HD597_003325 [Nonomuraea thailandensis]|uniref:Uncharacterized protein n=1 Tax=Nonomuraea thailandensis TaxID=1188745 RepID=A0A9X2K1S6_9ACTN|nr:hypothetical protein [Nonomuraea thailandensis]MCP2356305.1 hypothetical protein [Nonomuraea thailandensis]
MPAATSRSARSGRLTGAVVPGGTVAVTVRTPFSLLQEPPVTTTSVVPSAQVISRWAMRAVRSP